MIYDCFMFFNEIELLDLRLRTLSETVDFFVLAEIGITHTGIRKPYYFDEYKDLFKNYNIIHVKENSIPFHDPWQVENAHRNLLARGYWNASPDDHIIISDADEIPNPKTLKEGIQKYDAFGMVQQLYCYYVNCMAGQLWHGSVVTKRKLLTSPQDARNRRGSQPVMLNDGGWHYTSMGGKDRIRTKFKSFAETAFNIPLYMNDKNLDECLETGKDLTDRKEEWAKKRFITDEEITHREVIEWSKQYPAFKK